MTLENRINALAQLGKYLTVNISGLKEVLEAAFAANRWFDLESSRSSLKAIATEFLDEAKLRQFAAQYAIPEDGASAKTVGLVLAGNIPLVGFHDILCVFLSGNRSQIKLSEKDSILTKFVLQKLVELNPGSMDYFHFVEKLSGFDAVLATGSNNTSRYFEKYFSAVPHIIRKNRNAIAVLNGSETEEELTSLGEDVFQYYGLGCRNVAKLYAPEGYDFSPLLEVFFKQYKEVAHHNKYKNNFDYNYALFMLNKEEFLTNDIILLKKDTAISSRIASLHFEHYDSRESLTAELQSKRQEIQCIVGKENIDGFNVFAFGEAQKPRLADFADGVDTMKFLTSL